MDVHVETRGPVRDVENAPADREADTPTSATGFSNPRDEEEVDLFRGLSLHHRLHSRIQTIIFHHLPFPLMDAAICNDVGSTRKQQKTKLKNCQRHWRFKLN